MAKHTRRSEGSAPPASPTPSAHSNPPTGEHPGLRATDGQVILAARVSPRASRDALAVEGDRLRVWLHAPPVEGAANAALIKLLADRLRLPPSAITIIRGASARNKQIAITGLSADEAWRRLAAQ